MKIHEFDPVIYPYKVWIIVDKNPSVIAENFKSYENTPIEGIEESTKGFAAFAIPVVRKEDPDYGVILFFRTRASMSYELVAHESSHAAKYLFAHIGADTKEHEPFEFVIGWIAGCCEKVKNNKAK